MSFALSPPGDFVNDMSFALSPPGDFINDMLFTLSPARRGIKLHFGA
jgi:hypothetical protein